MKTVWKYQFATVQDDVVIPANARIVHVGEQGGKVTVWAEVVANPVGVGYARYLVIVGTGHPIPDRWEHVGTVVQPPWVWHVYAEPHVVYPPSTPGDPADEYADPAVPA